MGRPNRSVEPYNPPSRYINRDADGFEQIAGAEHPASCTIGKRVCLTVDDDSARARLRVAAGLRSIESSLPGIEDREQMEQPAAEVIPQQS